MLRRPLALLVVGIGSSIATPLRAEPIRAQLAYRREPGADACPGEPALRRAVVERLGYDPFDATASRAVRARVAPSGPGFVGTVVVTEEDTAREPEERRLRTEADCSELILAMALSISVALDPTVVFRAPPEPVEPPPPEPPPRRTEPRDEAPRAPTGPTAPDKPGKPVVVSAGLGPTMTFGEAPAPVAGGAVYGAIRRGWLGASIEARMTAFGSTNTELGVVASRSTAAVLGACLHGGEEGSGSPLSVFFGCALAWGSYVTAKGADVPIPRREEAWAFAAGARVGVALPLTRHVELRVAADGLADLTRHNLRLRGVQVYEYPVLFGGVLAGVGATFR